MPHLTQENRFYHNNFIKTVLATVLFISTYYLLLPALPLHIQSLGANKFEIGLIMGVFSVSSLILRPISGQLVDMHGRKKVMILAILTYLITPLLYLAGSHIAILIVIQALYGFAIGGFTISANTYVSDIAPAHLVASVVGWLSIALIMAKGLAPAIGTHLYDSTSFMTLVWLSLLFSLLALFLTSRVEEPPRDENASGPKTPYLKVISDKLILLPTITLFCGLISFGVISVMLPLFAQSQDIKNIENFFVLNTLTVMATRLFTGKLQHKHLPHLVSGSLLLLIISLVLMSFVNTMNQLLTVAVIYGFGYGAFYPALTSMVVLTTPLHHRGAALGFFTAAFDLGVSAGTLMGGLSEFFGFRTVYLLSSLIPLSGLLFFLLIYLPQLKIKYQKTSSAN